LLVRVVLPLMPIRSISSSFNDRDSFGEKSGDNLILNVVRLVVAAVAVEEAAEVALALLWLFFRKLASKLS